MRKGDTFGVAYVKWTGDWVVLRDADTGKPKVFKTRATAQRAARKLAQTKAENGRATVFIHP